MRRLLLLLLLAPGAHAQPIFRADFERAGAALPEGWVPRRVPPGAAVVIGAGSSLPGRHSLALHQPREGERIVVSLDVPAAPLTGAVAVRLSAWIRTELQSGHAGIGMALIGPPYGALGSPPAYVTEEARAPGLLVYEEMRNRGPQGTTPWTRYEITLPAVPGVTAYSLGVRLDGVGRAWVDDVRIEALGAQAFPAPAADATAYLTAALDTLEAHVLGREGVSWPAFRARVQGWMMGAQTPRETYPALTAALRSLNPHSTLLSPEQMADWEGADGAEAELQNLPEGEMLGRLGYLYVPGIVSVSPAMMDRYAQTAHSLLAAQDSAGACGYVVDLRGNTGGNDLPMQAAVGPLLYERDDDDGRHYAAGTITLDADPLAVRVARPARARPEAPVAVLMGPNTGSSGESTLLRFVGRPGARTFGQPSAGFTTGNEVYRLADGAGLVVTEVRMRDRTGRLYGGTVLPDEPVAPGTSAALNEDPVVQAALTWLGTRAACARR